MKAWCRFGGPKTCGGCRQVIEAGDPVLQITGLGTSVRRTLYRCERCAGAVAPAEIPTVEARSIRQPSPPPMLSLRSMAVSWSPADWRKKAANDEG